MSIQFINEPWSGAVSTANQASITSGSSGVNINVGDVVVVAVAVDNNATVDGDEGAVTSITDNVATSTTYVKVLEFCNSQGSAQAGVTVSVWMAEYQTDANNSQITINFSNSASRDRSAVSSVRLRPTEVLTLESTHIVLEGAAALANDGSDPGSLNVTTRNVECFRWRIIGSESNSTTGLTVTSGSWTLTTQSVSTGGGSAANIGIRGESTISTGTGDPSDPSLFNADHASVYVAFSEQVVRQNPVNRSYAVTRAALH